MPRTTIKQILRYRFDSFMARGGSSIFMSLVLVFLSSLLVIAALRALTLSTPRAPPKDCLIVLAEDET